MAAYMIKCLDPALGNTRIQAEGKRHRPALAQGMHSTAKLQKPEANQGTN